MDILSGCVDFRLEADQPSSQNGHVCIRYGSLFRLRVFFNNLIGKAKSDDAKTLAPAVQGYLEMTAPGGSKN